MGIAYNTSIVRDGLVLHLDAANPKSYPGSGTTWYDLSGNGNHGTMFNGPAYTSSNHGGIVFDGVDDYGVVSGMPTITNAFTNEAWVYFSSLSGGQAGYNTIFKTGQTTPLEQFYFVVTSSGSVHTEIRNDANTSWENYETPANTIQLNKWYQIVQQFDMVKKNIKYYINGILTSNFTTYATHSISIADSVFIAQQGSDVNNLYARRMVGKLPTIRIYNRALSAAEIKQNFNALRGRYGL